MNSYEFNALSNTEKLLLILENSPFIEEFDMHTVERLGEILDSIEELDVDEERIALVQFLSEEGRGRGCEWCGG